MPSCKGRRQCSAHQSAAPPKAGSMACWNSYLEPFRTSKESPMTPTSDADPSHLRTPLSDHLGTCCKFQFISSKCPKMVSPGTPKWRPKSSNSVKMSSSRPLPKQVSKTTPKKSDFGASFGGFCVAQLCERYQRSHLPRMALGSPNNLQNDSPKTSFGATLAQKIPKMSSNGGYQRNLKK